MRARLPARLGRGHLAVAVAVSLTASGCDPDPDPDEPRGAQAGPGPASWTHGTDLTDCTHPDYQEPMEVGTDIPEELPLLEDIAACASDTYLGVWLSNSGEAVWRPETPLGGETVHGVEPGTRAHNFAVSVGYAHALLVPGQSILVEADPADVKWLYDADLSTTWGFMELIADTFADKAPDQVADVFDPKTVRGKAVSSCAKLVWSTATSSAGLISNGKMKPSDAVVDAVGTGAAGSACYDDWKVADRQSRSPVPLSADDLRSLQSRHAPALQALDEAITATYRTQRTVGLLFQLVRP